MFLPYPVPNTAIPNPQSTGYGHNPARSLPFPQPQNMPQGCWFSGAVRLPWGAPPAPIGAGINPYFRGVLWTSPIYDLRPNLRGMQPQGTTQISPGSAGNAMPIWGWSSHMLYVQISNLLSGGTEGTPGAIPAGQFLPGQNLKLLTSEWGACLRSRKTDPSSPLYGHYFTGGHQHRLVYFGVSSLGRISSCTVLEA